MLAAFDVLVTGGSSPLGSQVIPSLLAAGYRCVATARSDDSAGRLAAAGVEVIRHDLSSGDPIKDVTARQVVHIAGIRLAPQLTGALQEVGAEHLVAVSSASATAPGHPDRGELLAAEEELETRERRVSVLRPTMIYGSGRDRNFRRIYRLVRRLPAVPRVSGGGLIMPVLADDVAQAILEALEDRESYVRPVGGPEPVRLGTVLDEFCALLGSPRVPVTVPLGVVSWAAQQRGRMPSKTIHALQMLAHDRVVPSPQEAGFRYQPTRLAEGVARSAKRYLHHESVVAPT
jgi:nucleoside-diphosphate-sugar epimerase